MNRQGWDRAELLIEEIAGGGAYVAAGVNGETGRQVGMRLGWGATE